VSGQAIFTSWLPKHSALWGHQPICLDHKLHSHPLFSLDSLAALIEKYPADHYMLVRVGSKGERKEWREGQIGGLSGRQVIESIRHGRVWLNLLRVNEIDHRYGELLDAICDEVQAYVPGHRSFKRINGILISSPAAQVYYHFDTSGQSLWQIVGRKRVFVYPATAPFLRSDELEKVSFYNDEVQIHYEPWFDNYAKVYEIGPGEMLAWPLNAPHRVENLDFSISMTMEYQTTEIRRKLFVNMANCLLREKVGINPGGRISGISYVSKLGLVAAAKATGIMNAGRAKRRPITFHLHPHSPGEIVDTEPQAAVA
jgi:hypothetical protein